MGLDLWVVMLMLFAFGWMYDLLIVDRMNGLAARYHPLTAFQVVVGVLVTLAGAWLVDGDCIGWVTLMACFAASGAPMTIGDIRRWYETL